jgi:hypothetical protein
LIMIRNIRANVVVIPLAALIAAFALTSAAASAQVVKPFKIKGSGIAPMGLPLPGQAPRPHGIVGEATQLGRHTGEGTVETDTVAFDPTTGKFVGQFGSGSPFVFVGANGEQLVTWYGRTDHGASTPGRFELTIVGTTADGSLIVTALFVAEFVPQPALCTGKFAGVTGSWIMIAQTEPFVLGSEDSTAYSWQGNGALTFQQGH